MSARRPSTPPPPPRGFPWVGIILAFVVAGLAIYQVIVSQGHKVDKYLVGALVVLALAFVGQAGDRLLERLADRWGKR